MDAILYVLYGIYLTGIGPVSRARRIDLEPGRVYRTRELARWSANPTRLAKRLVREGTLRLVAHGLYYLPVPSRFGPAPATEAEVMRAFLGASPFLISGPRRWNGLGLGSSAHFAVTLVYNTKRTGEFAFDGRRYLLRRVRFPDHPPEEWSVIDLLQHQGMAGVSLADLEAGLTATVRAGRWNVELLADMARQYGTKATQALVDRCTGAAGRPA